MNIVFLGTTPGRASVSSNLIAISSMASMKYNMDIAIMQTKFDTNRIEDAFMPVNAVICMKEDFAYYRRQGIDEIMDGIRVKREGNLLEDTLIRVKNTSLYYMPSTREQTKEVYDRGCEELAEEITLIVKKANKAVFVDCGTGDNVLSMKLIKEAQVIVINIEQDSHPIPKVIFENKELMEKCLFIIGRYDSNSRYNVRNIRRKYHIDKDCIAVVPYNIEFKDAVCEGKMVDFMDKNISCQLYDDNYEFINGVDYSTRMVLRKAGCHVE